MPTKSLRQGDPLSPYLFLLCAEGLSCVLKKAVVDGSISGLQLTSSSPLISHLFFADDSIIFACANELECLNILNVLGVYEQASGQKLNLDRTVASFSPIHPCRFRSQLKSCVMLLILLAIKKILACQL